MDAHQFDSLAKALVVTARRRTLPAALGGVLVVLGSHPSAARDKGRRKRKRRKKRRRPACQGSSRCVKGTCVCPGGGRPCGGVACCRVPEERCCNGACAPAASVPDGGACGSSAACCPGSVCTVETETNARVCCASGNSCDGTCCPRAHDVCTVGDRECCRPDRVCHKSCCALDEFCDELNCRPIVIGP